MTYDRTDTVVMGPLLAWPTDQGPSPVCNGTCAKGRPSWSYTNGVSLCGSCGKPSQGYLKVCEICEQIYLYDPNDLASYRIQDFNPVTPRVLPHAACAKALEEMANG
jgi:hypothetical protein